MGKEITQMMHFLFDFVSILYFRFFFFFQTNLKKPTSSLWRSKFKAKAM